MLHRIHRILPLTNALYSNGKQRWCTGGVGSRHDLAGSQSGKVQVDEGSIWFERRGKGKHPILCMPGALGTALTDFKPQFEYFGNSEAYTIVGYDPLGYGSSRPPQRQFHLGAAHFLRKDAVHAHAAMKALGYDQFSVLGWSDGGVAALFLAAQFPESVRKMVVWGANAYVSDEDIEMFLAVRDVSRWSRSMRAALDPVYGPSLGRLWAEWVDSMVMVHSNGGDLCRNQLRLITCPTLVMHGEKDPLVPSFHPVYLRDSIARSQLVYFAEGKHNLHIRFAEEFNSKVDTFLRN